MNTVSAHSEGPISSATAHQLFQEAVVAAKTGDTSTARHLFERVTRSHPNILQAWLWRAHLAAEPREQLGYLRRARQLDPANPKTRATMVHALVEAGIACAKERAKPEARRFLTEATQLDPALEAAWMWLASLADTSPERLRYVEKVLAINPTQQNAVAWKAELDKLGGESADGATASTVLVIDDSLTVRSLVNRTLTRRGCQVRMAADAAEALKRLRDETPDLIFLDIDLPDTNGFELCKLLKSQDSTRDVPVLMLSGKDTEFDKMRGRQVGAADHISKPFRPDDLVKALRQFCP